MNNGLIKAEYYFEIEILFYAEKQHLESFKMEYDMKSCPTPFEDCKFLINHKVIRKCHIHKVNIHQ